MINCPGTVLFLAGSPMWAHIYGIRNGMLSMGARVLTVGTPAPDYQPIMEALHKHDPGFSYDLVCEPDEDISQILARLSAAPDLILYMENAEAFLPNGIASVPIPTIGVLTEDFSHADWEPDLFTYFDIALSSLQESVDTYRDRGHDNLDYWYIGGADTYHRDHQIPRTYDVCMLGGLGPLHRDRAKTVARVLPLREEGVSVLTGYGAYFEEYSRIYSQSKIVINRSAVDQLNMRVLEAAACGAMVLTNLPKNRKDPSAHFLTDREEVVYYRSDDEVVDLIRYYLRHDEERERIATAGQKKVLENHSYGNVAAYLFSKILPRLGTDFLRRRQERLSRWGIDEIRQTLDYAKYFYLRGNANLAQRYYEKADKEAPSTLTAVGRGLCSALRRDLPRVKSCMAEALQRATSSEESLLAKINSAISSHFLSDGLSPDEVIQTIAGALDAVQADKSAPTRLRDWLYFPPVYDRFRMETSHAYWRINSDAERWARLKELVTYRLSHTLGLRLLDNGNRESAIHFLTQAAKLIPDDGRLLLDLARAYLAGGDQATARAHLQAALEAEPFNTQVQQAISLIQPTISASPDSKTSSEVQPLNRASHAGPTITGFSTTAARGRLPDPLPSPLYLNLGCGLDVRDGFVNIDLFSDDTRVVGMDVRRLELPDGCADGIIASDILEHFSHREVDAVLREWARVLKPGGKLAIRCPSLKLQAKAYLSGKWDADVASYMIFGGQTNPGDYHCMGFDQASMTRHLLQAGLEPVAFEEVDTPQDRGFVNLNMIAHAKKTISKNSSATRLPFGGTELLSVAWEGSQFVHHSLALVNRELCLQLIDAGHEISIIPYEQDQFGPDADARFPKLAARHNARLSRSASIHVRHHWPPNFEPPREGHWVMIQPWEFGSLPREWIERMKAKVDEVWIPSSWVRQCYVDSGMPAERVHVVPNGVNIDRFRPDAPPIRLDTTKRFKFLFVGGTIYRKGIDILLDAYVNSFSAQDDVCLVIKDMGGNSFYRGQTAEESIRDLQARPDAPEILYLTDDITEAEMPGLYTACDCLVHPYRGEGFGLPIAEAMASGLPVIVTGAGACLDFCDDTVAYLVPAEKRYLPENRIGHWETVGRPYLYEPDRAALASLMRRVYDNPSEARGMAACARQRIVDRFTWKQAAEKAIERMRELSARPVLRFQQPAAHSIRAVVARSGAVSDLFWRSLADTTPAEAHITVAGGEGGQPASAGDANPRRWAVTTSSGSAVSLLNRAIQAPGEEPVLLLSTDLVFTAGWLDPLLRALETNPSAAVVGPVSNRAPRPQRINARYDGTGKELRRFAARRALAHRGRTEEVPYLGGFCLLFNRSLCQQAGPLREDLELPLALWEYLARLRQAGHAVLLAHDSFVHHERLSDEEGAGFDELAVTEAEMDRALTQGQASLQAGDLERAIVEFTIVTQRFPDWAAGHLALASALMAQERFADAIPVLKRAAELAPQSSAVQNQLGIALFRIGEVQEAEEALRQAERCDPRDMEPRINLIELYRAQGRYEDATAALRDALAIDRDNPDLLALFGAVCLELGDAEGARMAATRLQARQLDHPALPGLMGALSDTNGAGAEGPAAGDEPPPYGGSGSHVPVAAGGGTADRSPVGRGLVPHRPDGDGQPQQPTDGAGPGPIGLQALLDVLMAPGREALDRGDLEGAAREFARLVEQHPDLAAVHTALGSTLMALDRPADAVPHLRRATEMAPNAAALHNQLGVALFQAGDPDAAEEAFSHARHADPNDMEAILNLVHLHRSSERYVEATGLIKEALTIDPNHPDALATFATLCLELGDREGAEMGLQRLLAAAPGHPEAAAIRQAIDMVQSARPSEDLEVVQ